MALTLTPTPYQTVLDSDGNPVSGAKVTTYLAGTTTAAATYTTSTGDVANANPIVADSAGRFVAYLSAGASYKFVITDSDDVAIDTQDNILAVPGASVNLDITGTAGEAIAAGEVCYISATGDASGTAGLWYLADADNDYSSTTAVEIGIAVSAIAINTSGTIRVAGEATTATSVVVGTKYYVSATAGAITSSAPTNSRLVGIAPTTSSLILNANTLTLPVVVAQGGTGKTSLTAYGVLLGGTTTTGAIQPLTPAAAGQLLKSGGTGAVAAWTEDPSVATLTLSTPLAVASGGTGLDTLTSANLIVGAGTSDVTFIAPGSSANVLTSNGSVWASTAPAAGWQPLNTCEGRLTATSGLPVTPADVSGVSSIFFTPYCGNKIALYDGSSDWDLVTFTEITISLSGLTASKPYDVFIYNNSGTATAETLVWTNTTTRATALAYQNGILVKSGVTTRRYIGTVYINSSGAETDDTMVKRYIWNYQNRVARLLYRHDPTNSWAYTLATVRQANGSTDNQVEAVIGVQEVPLRLTLLGISRNSTGNTNRRVGIGVGTTTAFDTTQTIHGPDMGATAPANQQMRHMTILNTYPVVGYQFYSWNENSTASGTCTWWGDDNSADYKEAGLTGEVWG